MGDCGQFMGKKFEKVTGKVIFLDIDGTLVGLDGKMPDSTRIALKEAKENGHKIVICTGRSKFQMYPWLLNMGFDGIIGAAGAYIEYEGKKIFHNTLRSDKLRDLLKLFNELGLTYILQSNCGLFTDKASHEGNILYFKKKCPDNENIIKIFFEGITIVDDINDVTGIETLVFFNDKVPLVNLQESVDEYFTITPSSIEDFDDYSGEITCRGIHKAIGAEKLLDHLGLDKSDCVAFGDGPNDIELLEFAGIGVAMGNGVDASKKVADRITEPLWEDGIYNEFKRLELI